MVIIHTSPDCRSVSPGVCPLVHGIYSPRPPSVFHDTIYEDGRSVKVTRGGRAQHHTPRRPFARRVNAVVSCIYIEEKNGPLKK